MPHTEIWVHAVWTTKNRWPTLRNTIRRQIFDHIKNNAISKGIHLDSIDGAVDHVHILVELKPRMAVSNIINQIKGESSRWVNEHKIIPVKLRWQSAYFAVSVSPGEVPRVRTYIRNQEIHHATKNLKEDWETAGRITKQS
jgi:putative transposase